VSVVLAIDLGGTSLRAALVDPSGRIVAVQAVASAVAQDDRGWAEVDPATWWRDLCTVVEALAGAAPADFAGVEAIAISAITRTQVFLDRAGRVLRPAILWQDTRAEALLPALRERCPADHPETRELGVFHPLARLWWLARKEPAIATSLAAVVDPKDYLNHRLTGVLASDPVSLARLCAAATAGPDGRSLLAAAGIGAGVVPRLVDPCSVVGRVLPGLGGPWEGLVGRPVIAMANDTWASVAGLGAMRPGVAYNLSGTTEVLGVVATTPATADGLLSVDWGGGLHQLGGPSQNGADALAWLASLVSAGAVGEALGDLLARPRDPDPLLFLPYLRGERVPFWDPSLRGAFIGLNRRHGSGDLAWAVMEGIAFLNRLVLERAEAGSGTRVGEVRFGGGGAASAAWCQLKADVLDRPIVTTAEDEHGLLGGAIVASAVLARQPSLAAAQQAMVREARRFAPAAHRRAHFDRLYGLFRCAHDAVRPVSHALAGWTKARVAA
jgi:xylulokinase